MPACTFTSKRFWGAWFATFILGLFISCTTFAASPIAASSSSPSGSAVDEDEFKGPYNEYGEFNEETDEEAEARFYQFGRFFGVSLGVGSQTVSGNRGILWQGGFPAYDLRVHYWFDFNLALNLSWFLVNHNFLTNVRSLNQVNVSMVRAAVDIVYYIDVKNLSSPITFANPHLIFGAGNYTKNQTSTQLGIIESDNNLGLALGGGIEIAIKPRRSYFQLQGKMHMVTFEDTSTTEFSAHSPTPLPDLSGLFFTVSGSLLFTW